MFKETFGWGNLIHNDKSEKSEKPEESEIVQAPVEKERTYAQYQKDGGVIDETNYLSALDRAKSETTPNAPTVLQAELMARTAGIELQSKDDGIDQRVALYAILRGDDKPKDIEHHHSQMSDQKLFAEVLRMTGDTDSLTKFLDANPSLKSVEVAAS